MTLLNLPGPVRSISWALLKLLAAVDTVSGMPIRQQANKQQNSLFCRFRLKVVPSITGELHASYGVLNLYRGTPSRRPGRVGIHPLGPSRLALLGRTRIPPGHALL